MHEGSAAIGIFFKDNKFLKKLARLQEMLQHTILVQLLAY
jgi:hypothetical protein